MGLEQRFRFPPSKEALRNRLGAVWLGTRARLRPARRASRLSNSLLQIS